MNEPTARTRRPADDHTRRLTEEMIELFGEVRPVHTAELAPRLDDIIEHGLAALGIHVPGAGRSARRQMALLALRTAQGRLRELDHALTELRTENKALHQEADVLRTLLDRAKESADEAGRRVVEAEGRVGKEQGLRADVEQSLGYTKAELEAALGLIDAERARSGLLPAQVEMVQELYARGASKRFLSRLFSVATWQIRLALKPRKTRTA